MSVIFLLIIISLTVALAFLIGFLWAVKNGQFEDDYSPAVRILFDDNQTSERPVSADNQKSKTEKKLQPETQD